MMWYIRRTILIILTAFLVPLYTYAASDNFTLRTQVGVDTTPPTAPLLNSVVPVSYNQINLSWSTSTDDTNLSGYQVFRDGSQIATTSNTFYEDIGLSASTTYAYYVTAFDWLTNISSSSNSVSTTTPALTPTTTPTSESDATGSGKRPLEIITFTVIPEETGVRIQYETAWYTKTTIEWGTGLSYELGVLQELTFKRSHDTFIAGLMPGNSYTIRITGESFNGRKEVLTELTFRTLPGEDVTPPLNPSYFKGISTQGGTVLTWKNPGDSDFVKTRIVRSDIFYPHDEADGWVVYEGEGESMTDTALADGETRYYTAFAYDAKGNISSGVVLVLRGTSQGSTTTPDIFDPSQNSILLTFEDIQFVQEGYQINAQNGVVEIDGTKPFTISIQYERFPEHLKTILVTLSDPDTGYEFQFLLRIGSDKTGYIARVAPLGRSGKFPLRVTVFDYTTTQVGYTEGTVESRVLMLPPIGGGETSIQGVLGILTRVTTSYTLWFVLLLLILVGLAHRILLRTT